ncbi:MAG: oxaloacetate decarboxylase [Betaproteobacteria bacterium]|nr:oxaloacetate decarboxylase [Betaproteobacteria bacterium]
MHATTLLRNMLESGKIVVAPGVYDGMSTRLVEKAGFKVAYASGGAIARSTGIPDLGLLSLAEIAGRLEQIVDVTTLPVIADADNGYGNALNAQRAARAFERAGVAAFHLEDQTFPKRCGHYDDKSVVPIHEMVGKLKAVRDALHDDDFVVIARTDAIAVEGFEAAIERCHAYVAAGADVAFLDAPTSQAQVEEIARRLPGWKLINMFHGGKTPLLPVSRLDELGYQIVIIPSDLQRAAIKAMQRSLQAISRDGSSLAMIEDLAAFDEREELVATAEFLARGKRYQQ